MGPCVLQWYVRVTVGGAVVSLNFAGIDRADMLINNKVGSAN